MSLLSFGFTKKATNNRVPESINGISDRTLREVNANLNANAAKKKKRARPRGKYNNIYTPELKMRVVRYCGTSSIDRTANSALNNWWLV